jgi:hypothetical protein
MQDMEKRKPPNFLLAGLFGVGALLMSEAVVWIITRSFNVSNWGHLGLYMIVAICAMVGALIGVRI